MKIKKISSLDILNILEYFLALFIILDCRSVYNHAIGRNYHILEFTAAVLIVILGAGIALKIYSINGKNLICFYLLEAFVYVFLIVNVIHVEAIRAYVLKFMFFLPFLTLFKISIAQEDCSILYRLMDKISTIMVFLAVVAVFFWFTGSVLKLVSPSNTFRFLWAFERRVNCYYGLYFEVEYDSFLFPNLYRNNGIFTESPMFSLLLSFSLFYRVLLKHGFQGKFVTKSNICLIVAIVTTFSVTGMIAVVMLFLLLSFSNSNQSLRSKIVKALLGIAIVVLYNVAELFLNQKLESDSGNIRVNDYMIGFKAWMDSPIFGGGYETRPYLNYIEGWRAQNIGFSNSIMWILSEGGLYLFILYIMPIVVFLIKAAKERDKYKAFFSVCILYLYATTTFAYQYLSLVLIGYFITNLVNRKRGDNWKMTIKEQLHLV